MTLVLLALGTVAFVRIVRRAGLPADRTDELTRIAVQSGRNALLILVPFVVARLLLQLDAMRFPDEPLTQSLRPLLDATEWGRAWIAQLGFTVLAVLTLHRWRTTGALAVTGIALTFPFSGHAAAVEPDRTFALAADAVHIIAAGAWLGTLGIFSLAWPATSGGDERARLVRTFSPVALTCAALLALTGLISTFAHLTLSDLTTSAYGRMLLVKLALVGGVLAAGWLNWKRNTARIARDDGAAMRSGMLGELAFAFAVVLATAVLVHTSPPPA